MATIILPISSISLPPFPTRRSSDLLTTPATPHLFLHGGGGVDDHKGDAASSPGDTAFGRTFTYTLNLTRCLADLRSEEHTSELQSHHDLVCRLLLEKKNKINLHPDI